MTAPRAYSRLQHVKKGPMNSALRFLFYGAEGVGKAQPVDALVLTPTGFVPIGTLTEHCEVIGSDGQPHRVVGVYAQGQRPVFCVTMTDGTYTECCIEHLWSTQTVDERDGGKVRSLGEIRKTLMRNVSGPHAPPDGLYPRHRVPCVHPVTFAVLDSLPLHPYILGALLGDGVLTNTCITFHKPEADVQERIIRLLPTGDTATPYKEGKDGTLVALRIRSDGGDRCSATFAILNTMDLIGTTSESKFIPSKYLFASIDDRIALLQGLCDTDGHVIHTGSRIEYSTASDQLRDGIVFLAQSLGGIVRVTERLPHYHYKGERHIGKLAHRITLFFPHGLCPVSSEKHLAKWKGIHTPSHRSIESIEPVGIKECVCIRIDSEDSLYVTDDFILTHNSTLLAHAPDPIFLDLEDGTATLDIARYSFQDGPGGHVAHNFQDVRLAIADLTESDHGFRTLVIDTVDRLEAMIWRWMIARDNDSGGNPFSKSHQTLTSIESYGYGKGPQVAVDEWRALCESLDVLRLRRNMHIALIGHAQIRTFKNPCGEDYDRFQPSLNVLAAGVLKSWCDVTGFCTFEDGGAKLDGKDKRDRPRGWSTGRRLLKLQRDAAYDAKSRISLPAEIELDIANPWAPLDEAIGQVHQEAKKLIDSIAAVCATIGDEVLAKKVAAAVKNAGANTATLARYLTELQTRANQPKEEVNNVTQ